jgi:hypothetical protein
MNKRKRRALRIKGIIPHSFYQTKDMLEGENSREVEYDTSRDNQLSKTKE